MLGDLGGAFSVPDGARWATCPASTRPSKSKGPMTPEELAGRTKVTERYARKWLSHQASSGYLDYRTPTTGKFA